MITFDQMLKMDGLLNDHQRLVIETVIREGGIKPAARKLGRMPSAIRETVRRSEKRAARLGYAPGHWESGTAPGYLMGKITVQRNGASGQVERTWERQSPDADRMQAIIDTIEERISRVEPLPAVRSPRTFGPENMLNHVTLADAHVGALAWHTETGSGDWDLNIARQVLLDGVSWLMDNLPPAHELVFMVLGDFTDTDGYAPLTPASKHLLDVDGRFPKIADTGIEVIETAVTHALTRYAKVRLVIKPGNHDPLTSWWMRRLFQRVFADNPRVEVDPSIRPYWAYLHGRSMICSHHGDKAAMTDLPGIFAADFASMWGQSTYRVCHTGHMHSKRIIQQTGFERHGMEVCQHPTLATRNAWAADKGLSAARRLSGYSYHSGGGMVSTLHYNPELDAA